MQVHDCFTGQRVLHKESGKLATIRRIQGSSGELDLTFDNGSTTKAHARLVEPAVADVADSGPMRPCPQCATKMPVTLTVCPSCGFEYGMKRSNPPRSIMKFVVLVFVLMASLYAVWKYVLHEKRPW